MEKRCYCFSLFSLLKRLQECFNLVLRNTADVSEPIMVPNAAFMRGSFAVLCFDPGHHRSLFIHLPEKKMLALFYPDRRSSDTETAKQIHHHYCESNFNMSKCL